MTAFERSDDAGNILGVACKVAAVFSTATIFRGISRRFQRRPERVIVEAPVVDVAVRENLHADRN